jgi:cystathionine beta-lyase/cystathionine gamma-synthase
MRRSLPREYDEPFYTRGNNPTVAILRKKLAALEGAEDALIFASGSGAVASAVMCNIQSGEHIVSVAKPYSWTNKLFRELLPRFGVHTTFVDGTRIENFEKAIRPETRIIYLESPNTFTFEMQDLEAVATLAKARGIVTMIDNSYASPLYQNPIHMGIDIVIHSASKYIGGHSDVGGGYCMRQPGDDAKAVCFRVYDAGRNNFANECLAFAERVADAAYPHGTHKRKHQANS